MYWKRYFRYFASLVICAIFVLVFFSGYITSADAPGWLRVGIEIETQWIFFGKFPCIQNYRLRL
jgi:hypothetical protein